MKKRWTAVPAVMLAACTQAPSASPVAKADATISPSPPAVTTPSPSGAASPSPSPVIAPSPDLPLTTVDFSCRLPAVDMFYPQFKGGFITFPAGSFALDPAGGFTTNTDSGVVSTNTKPSLHGDLADIGVPFYDAAQARWVPAGSRQATPDGSSYAYTTWDPSQPDVSSVHVVDVATATDRAFQISMPVESMGFTVADFDSGGVYLLANGFEQLPEGVWSMNPTTGVMRRLVQVGHVAAVRAGYAWAAVIDPRDPSPPQLRRSGTPSDSIVRVDLGTGARTVSFYRPGKQVELSGFDSAAHPIVDVTDPNDTTGYVETWLAADPSRPTLIHAGHLFLGAPQGDGTRIWFSGLSGVYLFTPAGGLRKVAAFHAADNGSITAAGFCR